MIDEDFVRFFASSVKDGFYGDIRLSETDGVFLTVENNSVRRVVDFKERGFGLRVMKNGIWGFASSNDLSKKSIIRALESAYSVINSKIKSSLTFTMQPEINGAKLKPEWKKDTRTVTIYDKLKLALEASKAATSEGTVGTLSNYQDAVTHWVIGSNAGNIISFYESHPKLDVACFVKDGPYIHVVRKLLDGSCGFELFDKDAHIRLARKAYEESKHLIGAKVVPGGKYDVVLDYAMTGVYTHEALGHAAEADSVLSRNSVLDNKMEKRVGSEMVTIIDDPTIEAANGSFKFDQEGTAAKKRTIVKDGILQEYLNTIETAGRLKQKPNGAARSMNYAYPPISRMSNTFIAPGDFKDDIYEGIKLGVSFYGFQYGYVDTGSGKFMFKAQYGRMIRRGKLAEYVRDTALTGSTLDVLHKIDAVGSDVKLDGGSCGKENQWVPVTSGGPDIRVRGMVVGGQ